MVGIPPDRPSEGTDMEVDSAQANPDPPKMVRKRLRSPSPQPNQNRGKYIEPSPVPDAIAAVTAPISQSDKTLESGHSMPASQTPATTQASQPKSHVPVPSLKSATSVAANQLAQYIGDMTLLAEKFDGLIKEMIDTHPEYAERASPLINGMANLFQQSVLHQDAAKPAARTPRHQPKETTYASVAQRAADGEPPSKRSVTKALRPPAAKADNRVMIRVPADHSIRQANPFEVRSHINKIMGGEERIMDVHYVRSGIALVAKSGLKATEILQFKDQITNTVGNASVEQQEKWVSFLLNPVPKRLTTSDGGVDVTPELVSREIQLHTGMTMRRVAWTKKSSQSGLAEGVILAYMTPAMAKSWPAHMRLFGQAVSVQPLRERLNVTQCEKCYGFHHTRNCPRAPRCHRCAGARHDDACMTPVKCVNCHGPHAATSANCPARPSRSNGSVIKPQSRQLKAIRQAGRAEWLKMNAPTSAEEPLAARDAQVRVAQEVDQDPEEDVRERDSERVAFFEDDGTAVRRSDLEVSRVGGPDEHSQINLNERS